MITRSTVLVLGAGASSPFGYPTGPLLKKNICDRLLNPGDQNIDSLEIKKLGFEYKVIESFRRELFSSGASSIDEFLERKSKYSEIGKIAIAQSLIRFEDTNYLFQNEDWYNVIFKAMATQDIKDFDKNKISIITFNYDRSLEHYLYTVLTNGYEVEQKIVIEKLKQIPILHLHGQIGYLKWQDELNFRDYLSDRNSDNLKSGSVGIKIINEIEAESNPLFKQARRLLNEAERIFFLGFGYHLTNIQRLKIGEIDNKSKEILGTSRRFYDKQREFIREITSNKITIFNNSEYGNDSVLQFLNRNVIFK